MYLPAGIAGDEALVGAIDEQVEVFQDDRAQKSGITLGLNDGGERAVAAKQLDIDAFGRGPLGRAARRNAL